MAATVLFCSDTFWDQRGEQIVAIDPTVEVVRLVGDERITTGDLERITVAFLSPDLWPGRVKEFMGTCVRAPHLEWFQSFSAGTDDAVFARLRSRGVTVTSAVGAAAPAIAHTVMLYLLALSRDLPRMTRAQLAHRWEPRRSVDLYGLRLGIVGLGAIGSEVARLAAPFGIEVTGLRRRVRGDEPCTTWTDERLGDLLAWADAIAVTAPLTDRTREMFGPAEFARMRPGAWFVNVGRGEVVDEVALAEALMTGHLGGAALDVFATEPLHPDSVLWILPNVIVTPHASGDTDRTGRRAVDLFLANFARRSLGEPLANVTTDDLTT